MKHKCAKIIALVMAAAFVLDSAGSVYAKQPAELTSLNEAQATISLDKSSYKIGEKIQISYTGTKGDDWIGIYRGENAAVGPDSWSLVWTYTKRMQQPDGSWNVNVEDIHDFDNNLVKPGVYEAILMENGGYKVLDRQRFEIKAGVHSKQKVYHEGDTIEISYNGTSGNDWIGIYRADNADPGNNNPAIYWTYMRWVSKNPDDTWKQPVNDLEPGEYLAILMKDGGYEIMDQTGFSVIGEEKIPDGIINFEVISDPHINSTDKNTENSKKLIDVLEDLKRDYPDNTVILNCGDLSDDGREDWVKGYYDIIGAYKDDFTFMTALGNHDVRWRSGWDEVYERYMRYNGQYMGDTKEVYYDKWINGYHFIVLNTEWDIKDRAYISPKQLEWLDKTMAENADPAKPIFVALHQPLNDTYAISSAWPVGVQDYALKEVLRKYPQTIMFTGHLHDGLGALEVVQTDYGVMVDVPCLRSNDAGDSRGQLGFHVTVYKDEVRLDLRDYLKDKWVPGYSYTFSLDPAARPAGKILDVNFDNGTAEDGSGNGNNGFLAGKPEFVNAEDGGKALHIVNSDVADGQEVKAEQYVDFGNLLQLGEDEFTVMFSYKGEKVSDGKWHEIAATCDRSGNMIFYLDGKAVDSKKISSGNTADGKSIRIVFGADGNCQNGVKEMYIDNVKVYKKVLGAAELGTTWNPYKVKADTDSITISWPLPAEERVEPAYVVVNGKKAADIASGATSVKVENLTPDTEYTILLVNREKSNSRNNQDAYPFIVKTSSEQRFKADKSSLEELLKKAEKIDTARYTEESVQAFRAALAKAKTVMADEKLSENDQQIVDEAVKALTNAIDGLKPASSDTDKDDNEGNTDKDNNEGSTDKDSNKGSTEKDSSGSQNGGVKAPETRDNAVIGLLAGIAVLALFMTALLAVKNKKK